MTYGRRISLIMSCSMNLDNLKKDEPMNLKRSGYTNKIWSKK